MAAYASLVSLAQTLENFSQDAYYKALVSFRQNRESLAQESVAASNRSDPSSLGVFWQLVEKEIERNQFVIDDGDDHLESLQKRIILLQEVFDEFPQRVSKWEKSISYYANHVERCIEHLPNLHGRFEEGTLEEKDNTFLATNRMFGLFDSYFDGLMKDMDADESSKLPQGSMILGKQRLFGLDHHLDEIKDRLLSHLSNVEIVPIVLLGELCKTSLARAAFDLPSVVSFFDLRHWVKVSQGYNAKEILLAILGDTLSDEMNASIIDLGVRINHLLYGKRYLIVLDDIWDVDAWDEVKKFLRDDRNRSRVILTTRHENLARYTKPSGFTHHMQLMDQETSWMLLEHKVFGEQPCPIELIEIGQKIATGCKGLPLAVVVVAGILANISLDIDSWEKIARDVNKAIEKSGDQFLEILSLSYKHLPHYLRPCFLYMSAFPKYDHVRTSSLMKLWVAEGFLKAKKSDVEQTAYDYFEELLNRNLIIATKKGYNGRAKHFQMHDLLRDLCIRKAQEEGFFQLYYSLGNDYTRRISFQRNASVQLVCEQQTEHLRSALCFYNHSKLLPWLADCGLLRVLDASRIISDNFPSLCSKHLRFLALSRAPSGVLDVPSDIHKFEKLETLILTYGYGVLDVPSDTHTLEKLDTLIRNYGYGFSEVSKPLIIPPEIWKLPKLRHLYLDPTCDLPGLPTEGILPLVNLQTLQKINNLKYTEEMVKMMPNLRKLVVSYKIDSSKETWSDFYFNNLLRLSHLNYLKLSFDTQGFSSEWLKNNPLMGSLTFPSSLKVLKFSGSAAGASWEDMTRITGSLPNLEVLSLEYRALSGDVWETSEDDFQGLKVLEICSSDLKCWRSESSNPFPSLEHLVLISCPYLIEFPEGIGDIPTLESITVDDHQEAILNWVKQIEDDQHDLGNTFLHVIVHKFADLKKAKEPESLKDNLIKIFSSASGDTAMMKRTLLSLFIDDADGLTRMFEFLSSEIVKMIPSLLSSPSDD